MKTENNQNKYNSIQPIMAAKYNSKKNKKPRLTKGRSLSMSPKNVGLHRRQCRNKHPLKKNTNMRIETCADCRAKVAKNGIMHSCKSCRFHVCKGKKKKKHITSFVPSWKK